MKNKRAGFTLVEILAAIVIISLIALIAIPVSSYLGNRTKGKLLVTKLELASSNSVLWAQDNKECFTGTSCGGISYVANSTTKTVITTSLDSLVVAGYMEYDENKKIFNPANQAQCIHNYLLEITYDKNKKTFSAKPTFKPEEAPSAYFSCDGTTTTTTKAGDEVTLTFDGNGGVGTLAKKTCQKSVACLIPTNSFIKEGNSFMGWASSINGEIQNENNDYIIISTDTTLYAQWLPNPYVLAFDGNSGSGMMAPKTCSHGVSCLISANAFKKTDYGFAGWSQSKSGPAEFADNASITITKDTTLYAQWVKVVHVVTFNTNGGSTPSPTSKSVTYGQTYGTLPTVTRSGYAFNGWYTGISGGSVITSGTVVSITANQTLYARWTVKNYTVTFNTNGGSTPSPTSKSVTYGQTYGTLPTVTRSGHTFKGWYTSTSGGTKITNTSTVSLASNQTLYAQWEILPSASFTVASGTLGSNSWYTTNIGLKITPSAGASGVSSFKYCITTATSCTPNTNGGKTALTVTLSTDSATNKACVAVTDGLGVTSAVKCSSSYKIDKAAPTTPQNAYLTYGSNYAYNGDWFNQTVYANYSPTGSTSVSGIAKYQISTDGSTWYDYNYNSSSSVYAMSATGTYTRYYRAVSNSGKVSGVYTRTAKIDKVAPTTPNNAYLTWGSNYAYTNNTWTKETIYANYTPSGSSDSNSGLAKYQISTNGSTWYDYSYNSSSSVYVMNTTGTHTRYYRAVDNAGNVSGTYTRTIKIDKDVPKIEMKYTGANANMKEVWNGSAKIFANGAVTNGTTLPSYGTFYTIYAVEGSSSAAYPTVASWQTASGGGKWQTKACSNGTQGIKRTNNGSGGWEDGYVGLGGTNTYYQYQYRYCNAIGTCSSQVTFEVWFSRYGEAGPKCTP